MPASPCSWPRIRISTANMSASTAPSEWRPGEGRLTEHLLQRVGAGTVLPVAQLDVERGLDGAPQRRAERLDAHPQGQVAGREGSRRGGHSEHVAVDHE